jgi:hypothetical protein
MSTFISYNDYQTAKSSRILDLITEDNDTLLDTAELTAIGKITDRLAEKFNLAAEFAKTGSDRNTSLMSWVLALSLYYIYARVPDNDVPERVIKDYDDTLKELEQIQQGKLSCSLQRITDTTTGEIKTRFRMGNSEPRTHDPYALA